jgi:adenylyl-sulfate kinase
MNNFVLFFTGLSGSGKSTIADIISPEIERATKKPVTVLDGDVVRTNLTSGLGFSKEDRNTNVLRIGWVAAEIAKHGGNVIIAAIAPYEKAREEVRTMVKKHGKFILVHVATSLETCEKRDVKGLYKRARKGCLKNFTGISDPYEEPIKPELIVGVDENEYYSTARVIKYLRDVDCL